MVVSQRDCNRKLTRIELDVLHMLTVDFLSPRQITIRRKTSQQATSKIICSLKKKGAINQGYQAVVKSQSTTQPQPFNHSIRLHGQEFNIKILYKDMRYRESKYRKLEGKLVEVDGNQVKCYKNSIEVYSGHSFFGETPQKATARSFEYWQRFFRRLENDFSIIVVKHRAQNITLVNSHYAEVGNEVAKRCELTADKIRIYAREDGKLWFTIDNSWNFHEAECLHPGEAKQDMEKVGKQLNDWRENDPPTLSQLLSAMKEMADHNKETAAGLSALMKLQHKPESSKIEEVRADYIG